MEQNERAYWTKEVAERLNIGESTLRKWCLALEENGYQFTKGQRGVRAFLERDIEVLAKMKTVLNEVGTTLDEAIKAARGERENAQSQVVQSFSETTKEQENDRTPVAMSPEVLSEVLENYKEDLLSVVRQEFQETLRKQEERTLERERRMEERARERDENVMKVLRETLDTKKMLAASLEEQKEEKKKSWWQKLFG
ncbi:MerR family transcriptional regulator [Priestia megaterium]|uniref:MerR family transcriptional regulator n=1 Tax=Priestia megaterium TaxID=1404 RepID=UPI0021C14C4A|nr:MerR family transcriptional regulator [Priestia megaterium]MCT9858228.1 MerR family transcriptional regulator [Priestia megaterium]MDF1958475.1 MerR family transcriptional regulator [Priestia megaterium]